MCVSSSACVRGLSNASLKVLASQGRQIPWVGIATSRAVVAIGGYLPVVQLQGAHAR
jgi:hypothetical protein